MDEGLADFVHQQIENGAFGSESEVIEAALRLLQEQDQDAIEAIRAAIAEGEASGEPQPFDFDEFLAEMRRKHIDQAGRAADLLHP
ncbi:type II toxin-antitoxin system ParD family antitoxin [Neorhizobium lilium]|uniref:type II toxin-antitoxin system ParD family antitoxin n=1 Tax=Neorhizobium lilium TaxID=2503024 RepID=UPI001FDF4116|nr:type II toxin-antitoxin system ParD family antitoxin [Neorhizobium lilium]